MENVLRAGSYHDGSSLFSGKRNISVFLCYFEFLQLIPRMNVCRIVWVQFSWDEHVSLFTRMCIWTHMCVNNTMNFYRRGDGKGSRNYQKMTAKVIDHWQSVVAPSCSVRIDFKRANEPQNALANQRSSEPRRYKNRRGSVPYFLQVSRPLG